MALALAELQKACPAVPHPRFLSQGRALKHWMQMSGPDRFSALAAEGVLGLQPYVPGKPVAELEREYGIRDSIKLASNENPLGPPPASIRAISAALGDLALYPDGAAFELKNALAERLAVDPAQITVGNGSNELLSLVAETFLTPAH